MGTQIDTIESRIRFVKKESADVGDGTAWPMLVTLDQLAEIMYRVRDAWFTAGSIKVYGKTLTIQAGTTYPLVSSISVDDSLYGTSYFYARGYNVSGTLDGAFTSHFAAPYSIYSTDYQDCNSEIGIWFPDYGIIGSPIISAGGLTDFRCGFSHIVGCENSDPWSYIPPDVYTAIGIHDDAPDVSNTPARLVVNFTGEVAYVGDNPFDPAAEIYLGVEMNGSMSGGGVRTKIDGYYTDDTGANFVLGLAGGDSVSCKLYSGVTHDSIGDFVLQAQKWWPYAKSNGSPAWSETTGLPL